MDEQENAQFERLPEYKQKKGTYQPVTDEYLRQYEESGVQKRIFDYLRVILLLSEAGAIMGMLELTCPDCKGQKFTPPLPGVDGTTVVLAFRCRNKKCRSRLHHVIDLSRVRDN